MTADISKFTCTLKQESTCINREKMKFIPVDVALNIYDSTYYTLFLLIKIYKIMRPLNFSQALINDLGSQF